MIYVVISDFRKLKDFKEKSPVDFSDRASSLLENLPVCLKHRIKETKSESKKMERFGAYITLCYSLFKCFNIDNLSVLYNENGKPYLNLKKGQSKIHVSISHSDTFSAIALSDEGEIGIDIEGEIEEERRGRLESRFFRQIHFNNAPLENVRWSNLEISEKGEFCYNPSLRFFNIEKDEPFSAKWTSAEAAMKCDGRGFSAINELDLLSKSLVFNTKSFIACEKRYYVSICKSK